MKSGYKLFLKIKLDGISTSESPMNKIWNNLWKLRIPSKIKYFCWKALKESLLDNYNLQHRGINISNNCPICDVQTENTDHCLFNCFRAKEIWNLTFNNVFLEENFNGSFIDRWIKIDTQSSLEELELVAVVCWAIWNGRNKLVHGEIIPPISIKSRWIKNYLESFRKENSRESPNQSKTCVRTQRTRVPSAWSPPPDGFWKLNSN